MSASTTAPTGVDRPRRLVATARRGLVIAVAAMVLAAIAIRIWSTHGVWMTLGHLVLRTGGFMWTMPPWPAALGAVAGMATLWMLTGRLGWLATGHGRATPRWLPYVGFGILYALALGRWLLWTPPDIVALAMYAAAMLVTVFVGERTALRLRVGRWWRIVPVVLAATMPVAAWWGIFNGEVIDADALSQITQARLMITGHVVHDVPQLLRDVIQIVYATETVPSFSQYPPGHLVLMAGALALGLAPQVVNIVGGGILVIATAALARRVHGGHGLVAGVMMATSPFFLVIAGEGMNHMTSAVCMAGVALCLMPRRGARLASPGLWAAALAGALFAWSGITRPLPTMTQGAVWIAVWCAAVARNRAEASRLCGALGAFVAGGAGPLILAACYNLATTGDATTFGYQVHNVAMHAMGFRASGPYPHMPGDALDHLAATLFSAWWHVGGWFIGSWVLVAAAMRRWRGHRGEVVLAMLCGAQLGAFAFYHFFDLFLGPRFQFEILPYVCVLLAAPIESALRRPATRALVAAGLVLLSVEGAASGLGFYRGKFAAQTAAATRLRAAIAEHQSGAGPLVLVMPRPQSERAGRWFPALGGERPLWIVPDDRADQARAVPALAEAEWVEVGH